MVLTKMICFGFNPLFWLSRNQQISGHNSGNMMSFMLNSVANIIAFGFKSAEFWDIVIDSFIRTSISFLLLFLYALMYGPLGL